MPRGVKQLPNPVSVRTKKFLSRKQAAEYLNVSITTLYRYSKEGLIKYHIRRGNHPVYEVNDLDDFNRPKELYEMI